MSKSAARLALVRSFVTAFNNHDPVACAAFFAEDGTTTTSAGVQAKGREEIAAMYRGQFTAFPDSRLEILKVTTTEEQVFAEYKLEGTHLGPLTFAGQEVAPTGRAIKVQYLAIATANEAGQLTNLVQTGDGYAMLRQLQIVPPPHMTEEKIASVVENLISGMNRRDLDLVSACFAPEATFGSDTMGKIQGRDAIRAAFHNQFSAYPDGEFRVTSLTIQDNTAIIILTGRGIQSGNLPFREATNREVRIENTLVAEVGPKGIFAMRQYVDGITLMKQLGFLPG